MSAVSTADLLRMLGPGSGSAAPGARPAGPGGLDFGSLLRKAGAGEASSGLPVTLAPGVSLDLSEEQLGRMAVAADKAAAQGSARAMVLMDGHAYTLDVTTRQVLGRAELTDGRVLTGVDAVVRAGDAKAAKPKPLGPPAEGVGNASLLSALAGRRSGEGVAV